MADSYVQGSFAFICSIDEAALIEEAWQLSADLSAGFEPSSVSPEFRAIFPPKTQDDLSSGFRSIFDDAAFPDFGADLRVANSADDPRICTVSIFSTTDFQPAPIAALIQRCCAVSLGDSAIGFEWSLSCSRPYRDSFGGGWGVVFADRIIIETTREALSKALAGANLMIRADPWGDDPAYPVDDWKIEVANDDTRLGYLDWVEARRSLATDIEASVPVA
ncbi:hypothetical protein [Sphingomonas sp.]|uniref:hypothetical protein n=1 Tax=Sphingomonas sp. TaxID=28214 RepID=UPI000DB262DC|nr:hypothetical protein [Sphingomonas sp.]PZU06053.1 MAG: hypothetical protein DI605_20265 [Sphingomonas sp.]